MKVLVVEDEKSAAKRLQALLKDINPDIEIIGTIDTVKGTAAWFGKNTAPDLLFLDIQLADGLSFDIFEQAEISCPVIFTTAYDQYALKAFEVYSIDYLLKPIDKKKLLRSLDKFKNMVEGSKDKESFD
jgi:two-component SAPR family response regulator